MRVGLQLPSFSFPGGTPAIRPTLTSIAQAAEANGFASLWVMDHFFQLPVDSGWGGPDEPMLEAYTTLGFLAQATERIALGPMVANAVARPPGLLVKAATSLDVLSGGRTYLGIGAAWYEREANGLGLPWPARAERFERLEETLRIALAMWAGDPAPIEGRHYQLAEPIARPGPAGAAAPPDHDRRRRGAADPPARRDLRGRLQHPGPRPGRERPQARGAPAALRQRRP